MLTIKTEYDSSVLLIVVIKGNYWLPVKPSVLKQLIKNERIREPVKERIQICTLFSPRQNSSIKFWLFEKCCLIPDS